MSLRTRLILSYTLIIFVCLGIAALAVSAFLQSYRDRVTQLHLDDIARPISVQLKALLRGQATIVEAWANMQEQAQNNRVYILFVDSNGNIVRQASPEDLKQLKVTEALPHGLTGPAHGIFTIPPRQKFVYAAYPLSKVAESQYSPIDTLVLCQPRGSGALILAGLISPFLWSGFIAFAVSILLAFFVARSVYHPVQRLSKAAENVAQGHYDMEVPVTGPSEIKGVAVNFNTMAKRVKESQQNLRHFVADVSHQLKTPLTSIRGFAQAMLDGTAGDAETKQKATRIIVDESQRMMRQVNEILELSRMQAGQIKMEQKPVNVKELLTHCQEIFALRAEEKGISFANKVDSDLASVIGDADRLEDVFCNLIDNAIKNTPSQGNIDISASNGKNNSIEIVIADTGPGIPPEQIPYVFHRFHQSGGLRTGFGLGLAIAQEVVLAHGGRIEVSSNPGEGARFTVIIPTTA